MILDGTDANGATPLSDDDLDGLIPTWVINRAELNLAEQANIEAGFRWALDRRGRPKITVDQLLTPAFSDELHRRMFANVWAWAGKRRLRETNIGVDPSLISVKMSDAFADARFWYEQATMPATEIAVRLHHRLVSIHPYRNGNGRQTRLMADLYLTACGDSPLSWGSRDLIDESAERSRYIAALRAADAGEYQPLLDFAATD